MNDYIDYNNSDSPTYHRPDPREFNVVDRINELKDRKIECKDDEVGQSEITAIESKLNNLIVVDEESF